MLDGTYPSQLGLVRNAGLAGLTALGLHEDDTIGTISTIDGGFGILQNRNRLYLVDIQVVELFLTLVTILIDKVVDNIKRTGVDVGTDGSTRHVLLRNQGHGIAR